MFAALKTAEQKMAESSDVNHVAKFLTYIARFDDRHERVAQAAAEHAPERVVQWLKTASPNVASSSLSIFAQAMDRFLGSNAPRSAFASMRRDMMQVPMLTRVLLSVGAVTAAEVGEGQPKPVRRLTLSTSDTETSKSVAQLVLSKEVLLEAPELAARMIASAMPEAVGKADDIFFLGKLAASESGESSSEVNPTWSAILDELFELLNLVSTGEASRLWLIAPPRVVKYIARRAVENGITTLAWFGGTLLGVNVIASAAQTAGRITLADASAIVYGDDGIQIRSSEVAAIEMLDNPTNAAGPSVTATSLVSMFQVNCRSLVAEHRIAVRVVDTDSVATLTGVGWGADSGSPQGA